MSVDHSSAFVEEMGGALMQAGLPRVPSLVFSALLVDDDGRMTANQLGSSLSLSAGAISGAVRYLQQVGMARRERERGSRRDVYVVDDDAWHGMMVRRDRLYAPLIRALDTALDDHAPADPAYHRIRLSAEFLRYVDEEMGKLAEGWAARKRELESP